MHYDSLHSLPTDREDSSELDALARVALSGIDALAASICASSTVLPAGYTSGVLCSPGTPAAEPATFAELLVTPAAPPALVAAAS